MLRSEIGISLEIIVNVFKYLITCSTKTLTLAVAPDLFISVGLLCDAPLFPERRVKCIHLEGHSSKAFVFHYIALSKKARLKIIAFHWSSSRRLLI